MTKSENHILSFGKGKHCVHGYRLFNAVRKLERKGLVKIIKDDVTSVRRPLGYVTYSAYGSIFILL